MIETQNLSRKFVSGKTALDALIDINLKVEEGELVALVGPSGSGKSTLLNLIGGLDYPTEGAIFINKKDISLYNDKELSAYRNSKVGFIFQEFNLEPFLTVKKNILLPSYFSQNGKGREEMEKEADKLIEEVELSAKKHNKVYELSGGQKQRTAIARAFINRPKIVLADEPTGNLDLKTGSTIIELLKESHSKHKTTMIIATHDENIAKAANRIIKIKDGKIC